MLIKCPECARDVSDSATSCPNCGHPLTPKPRPPAPLPGPPDFFAKKDRTRVLVITAAIIGAFILLVVFLPKQSPGGLSGGLSGGGTSDVGNAATGPAWRYSQSTDPITSKVTKVACITSLNEAQLSFPYHDVTAHLCVEQSEGVIEGYVELNGDGQMLCDIGGCYLPVRFDNRPAKSLSASEASDHSTNILFINEGGTLLAGLKSSKKTLVQVRFYQNGDQDLVFPTAGLTWK